MAENFTLPIKPSDNEIDLGSRVRKLRKERNMSQRVLSDLSRLNINTLSLIEQNKTSPSVSTLQQLATALEIPIGTFFEPVSKPKKVVYTPVDQRPARHLGDTQLDILWENYEENGIQAFVVTLLPGRSSGERPVVHTGHEFVLGLSGTVSYLVDGKKYLINQGDSLLFEAHLPHQWINQSQETAQFLLIFYPQDLRDQPEKYHFVQPEVNTKIAFITDDGITISQHFGRASHYLVVTIQDGKELAREMRSKIGHIQFHVSDLEERDHNSAQHGMDQKSHEKHVNMAEVIQDCEAVISGGMGQGAYNSMQKLNIKPIVTDVRLVENALAAYLSGGLEDHTERLH